MSALELRVKLRDAGYTPVPCRGKRPTLSGWQTLVSPSTEAMQYWAGTDTGAGCRDLPTLDFDIDLPAAADRAEEVVKEFFDDRGMMPVRFGRLPRRAMPFRTEIPFSKMIRRFTAPNGHLHKIELLCAGQQFLVAGTHEDTGEPYTWHPSPLWDMRREDLVEVTESEMTELLDELERMLADEFGFERTAGTTSPAGGDPGADEPPSQRQGPVDVAAELDAMVDGGSVNDAQKHIIPSLLAKGEHPDDVLELVVNETMAGVGDGLGWDVEKEKRIVIKRILAGYNNVLLDKYDYSAGVPGWLPGEFHEKWTEAVDAGRRISISYNRYGFFIRPYGPKAPEGDPKPKTKAKSPFSGTACRDFRLVRLETFDPHGLPPRPRLYGPYTRGQVTLTVGTGGMGKSSVKMVEGVAMATGRNLLGEQPGEAYRVWYHCGEDDIKELQRRLAAICVHYKLDITEVLQNFYMTSGAEFPLNVAHGFNELKIDVALLDRMADEVMDKQIDLAMFDPLITLHGVNEQDNNKMDRVARLFCTLAIECDCGVGIAHHARKLFPGTHEYSGDDSRGASAVKDAVRASRVLNQMTAEEAREFGVDEVERLDYFRVDRAKVNTVRRGAPPEWRRFSSVSLGRPELGNEEEVGVVEAWLPPDRNNPSPERVARRSQVENVFLVILARLDRDGRSCNHLKGTRYAPKLFAEEPEAKALKAGLRELEVAMLELIHSHRVKIATGRKAGRDQDYLSIP